MSSNPPKRKSRRKKAIIRRRVFVALCLLVLASVVLVSVFVVKLFSGRDTAENITDVAQQGTATESGTLAFSGDWHYIPDVPMIEQSYYQSACESVSAVMALNYIGVDITVDDFLDRYLNWEYFFYENGVRYGYHPNNCFMNNPYTIYGFGCYAPCIEKAIIKLLPQNYTLINTTGKSIDYLCENYIDKDIPVIFWATEYMNEAYEGPEWTLIENGETFTWLMNEHCLVLTGYDEEYYYFNDPLAGKTKYARAEVEKNYKDIGRQSLVVCDPTVDYTELDHTDGEYEPEEPTGHEGEEYEQ